MRLAANHAIDREAVNQSETLGFSKITGSTIPRDFEYYWPAPLTAYDPKRARQLLAEAGHPNGFDAGEIACDGAYASLAEALSNYLAAVGIRAKLRPYERAAFFSNFREKKFRHLVQAASGAFGNAATRLDTFVAAAGIYTYGTYADIEGLMLEQAGEPDRKRREQTLHRVRRLHPRKGDVRADLRTLLSQRPGAAGGGVGAGADQPPRLLRAVRRPQAQGETQRGSRLTRSAGGCFSRNAATPSRKCVLARTRSPSSCSSLARARVRGDRRADLLLHRLHSGGPVRGDPLGRLEPQGISALGGDDAD